MSSPSSSSQVVVFRKTGPDDLLKIVEHMKPAGDTPFYPFTDLGRLRRIPHDGLIVAERQSEYAGFLYWYHGERPEFDEPVARYGYIEELQVVEKFRGQGIGRKLLTYALNRMKEAGLEAAYLRTREGNTPTQNLYESLGFRPFSRQIRYKLVIS